MLRIEGKVDKPMSLSLEDLRDQFQAYTVDTSYANDERIAQSSFTGARLWDILQHADVLMNSENPELMRVMARSVDHFRCVVKWHEFAPDGDNKLILVGYLQNGQPIHGKHGPLRLVVPGDAHGLRYIGNLATLSVLNDRATDE
ncbi:MAG: molybdopterin-dependent oxidoreductase [Anaerolineaceae bacterium]|nr:molybdopterin-dependent oxidoreductase [Anaerolineaceae bacterium]